MLQRNVRCGAVLALICGFLLGVEPASAAGPAPNPTQAQFEIDYLTKTIDHHFMAASMADLCPERAAHPQLVDLCARIAADQTSEIAQMQSWLTSWYNMQHEPQLTADQQAQLDSLAALDGADFEIAFMNMMTDHHKTAIRDAIDCVKQAYHAELRNFCRHIILEQGKEIVQMQVWLCRWYNQCPRSGQ